MAVKRHEFAAAVILVEIMAAMVVPAIVTFDY